jgi:hypothetical protein
MSVKLNYCRDGYKTRSRFRFRVTAAMVFSLREKGVKCTGTPNLTGQIM